MPCEYELDVLRLLAGRPNTIKHWGAALGQAIEVCVGSGWAIKDPRGAVVITSKGLAVLDAAGARSDPPESHV